MLNLHYKTVLSLLSCLLLFSLTVSAEEPKAEPTPEEYGVIINLSGKQRMLTQKMSKEFFLIAYGHEVADNKLNLFETATLFDRTITGLQHGDESLGLNGTTAPHIVSQLELVEKMWADFKPAIYHAAREEVNTISDDIRQQVADENVPLLREMNKAVGMYEKQAVDSKPL